MHLKSMLRKFSMIWAKEFKVNMPQNLKLVAEDYIRNYDHEPFNTYKSVANSKMWVIPPLGNNRIRLDDIAVFFCPRGELTVTMHDKETKEVLDTKVLDNTNAMSLYHTEFMHDIHGVGDLVVFGVTPKDLNYFMKR